MVDGYRWQPNAGSCDGHYGPNHHGKRDVWWPPAPVSQAGTHSGCRLTGQACGRSASNAIDSKQQMMRIRTPLRWPGPRGFVAGEQHGPATRASPYAEATAVTVAEPVRAGTTARRRAAGQGRPGLSHPVQQAPRPVADSADPDHRRARGRLGGRPRRSRRQRISSLKGSDQPLAVFEGAFPIEARLAIAKDHPAGEITVPARLRYQACDETTCFRPMTIAASWTLNIVAAGGKPPRRLQRRPPEPGRRRSRVSAPAEAPLAPPRRPRRRPAVADQRRPTSSSSSISSPFSGRPAATWTLRSS